MGKGTIRNMRSRMYRIGIEIEIKSKRDKELFVLQIIKYFVSVSVSKYGQTL